MKPDGRSVLYQVLSNGQQVELLSDGQGARQYHELRQELNLGQKGAFLIQALLAEEKKIGLLILARGPSPTSWSEEEKALAKALGALLGRALSNAQRYQLALAGQAPDFDRELGQLKVDLEHVARQRDEALGRVDQLSDLVTQLGDQLSFARERLEVGDRKLRETTQALALAIQRQKKAHQLEEELAGLREALSEAELALAYAAAGEAGLSTEWVMRTVTHYSGELEEAQAQISALEDRLKQPDGQELLEQAASIMGRLRTPLTALGGYTDLMLDRATGELSAQQESLLRRMRVNVDNMSMTVDTLSVTSRSARPAQDSDGLINVHEALEEAIYVVSPELQSKKLRVDVYVEESLPSLEDPANSLSELLVKVLSAACLVSTTEGRLYISAREIRREAKGAPEQAGFLRVSVGDDGGAHSHALFAGTIVDQGPLSGGRPSSGDADLAQLLDAAYLMASSHGGRCWLDLAHPKGSTLILLLPLPAVATDKSG
jgi:signal transduction histidine kinase